MAKNILIKFIFCLRAQEILPGEMEWIEEDGKCNCFKDEACLYFSAGFLLHCYPSLGLIF